MLAFTRRVVVVWRINESGLSVLRVVTRQFVTFATLRNNPRPETDEILDEQTVHFLSSELESSTRQHLTLKRYPLFARTPVHFTNSHQYKLAA